MRKPLVLAAAVATAAATLAACGSSSSSATGGSVATGPATPTTLAADYQRTVAASSAKVSFDEAVVAAGKTTDVTGAGVIAFSGREADFTVKADGFTIEVRLIGSEYYIKLPSAEAALTGGKPWLSLSLAGITKSNPFSSEVSGIDSGASYLALLKGISTVRKVGTSSINGASATEYSATISLSRFVARSGLSATAVKTVTAELGSNGTLPLKLWIDGSGRVVQEQFSVVSHAAGAAGAAVSVTIGFSDFGTPVNVTAPPASQTENFSKALGGLSTSVGSGSSSSGA